MATRGDRDDLEQAIAESRLAERLAGLMLQAFSEDELAALPADLRAVLDMLFKRRLRQPGPEPSLEDCLRLRQQFEQYCDNRAPNALASRLAAQLR